MGTILHLTRFEILRMTKSPAGLYTFIGVVGFLGTLFWLFSTFSVVIFLDLAYLVLPLFLILPAATLVSRDRETGYASVLFTHPVSPREYYASKLASVQVLTGIYLLVLSPFAYLTIAYAGHGWLSEILARIAWTWVESLFAGSLGLLLSASLGRRATTPSIFLGLAIALLLSVGPFQIPHFLGAVSPEFAKTSLAILHASPLMGAMDFFTIHGMYVSQPLLSLFPSLVLTGLLLGLGHFVYARLQSPEGWEVPESVQLGVLGIVVTSLVVIPALPPYDYEIPQFIPTNCQMLGDLRFCTEVVILDPVLPGSSLQRDFVFQVSHWSPLPVTLEQLSLSWRSEFFAFNRSSIELGPITFPPAPSEERQAEVELRIPVTATALRSPRLGDSPFGPSTPIVFEIRADDWMFLDGYHSWRVVGLPYARNTAWLVTAALATAGFFAMGRGRWRRRDS